MNLIEVNNKQKEMEFLQVPLIIYKNDSNWIRTLDKDIKAVFDPKKNKLFRNGQAKRWILKDDRGQLIGRVAAFYDKNKANSFEQPTGSMGFFECINDKKTAFLLFETCRNWLVEAGMEAMDGPINFGEKDRFWGLQVEGLKEAPTYCVNYNPDYYQQFFEVFGFQTYYNQLTFWKEVHDPLPEKFEAKAKRISDNPNYHMEHFKKNRMDDFIEAFRKVYNEAWVTHDGFQEMDKKQANALIKKLKPIMDERLIWFAYFKNEPIGFLLMLPELNQIFKYVNGKLNWLGKLKFLYRKWKDPSRRIHAVAFGISPLHQGKGLEGALTQAASLAIRPSNAYDDLEITWIGDFNPKMIHIIESLGTKPYKKHITYRYLFDREKEFKRSPIIR